MRAYLIGAGVAVLAVVLWQVAQRMGRNGDAGSDEHVPGSTNYQVVRSSEGDIEARRSDPASFAASEWSSEPEHTAKFRHAAAEAPLLADLYKTEGRQWAATRLALEDPLVKEEEEERCKQAFGAIVDQRGEICTLTIGMVARRRDDGTSDVVYAAAEIAENEDDECSALAGCLARGRLGTMLPLPAAAGVDPGGELAVRQRILVRPVPENVKDAAHLIKTRDLVREDLRLAREAGMAASADDELHYRFLMTERILNYLEHRLEVVGGKSSDP